MPWGPVEYKYYQEEDIIRETTSLFCMRRAAAAEQLAVGEVPRGAGAACGARVARRRAPAGAHEQAAGGRVGCALVARRRAQDE